MYTIYNKFVIGEECYTAVRVPVHYKCPICVGDGKFDHNGYEIYCKNCNGTGRLHDAHQFVLESMKVKISSIRASIADDIVTIKYKVSMMEDTRYRAKNRAESTLFKTKEEADEYCKKVNTKEIKPEY